MALTLRVTSFQNQALGADSTREFGAQGGAIGRALDNDWVLPDPDKFVSSHHALVLCRGGNYFLQDTSTNGTFINGSPQPVGKNAEQQFGGIMEITEEMGDTPPHWLNYIAVSDVDASVKKAESLGAKICVPPQDIPGIGRFSVFTDPTGAAIAVFQGP